MKRLVIEEMRRAIEIMESKPEELSSKKKCDYNPHYEETDRDIAELKDLFKAIRRHTVQLEKRIEKRWS